MAADAQTCPACGARVAADAPVCDLCGHAFGAPAPDADDVAEPVALDRLAAPAAEGGVFCTACGQRNPAGARFCARCGTPLQALDGPVVETVSAPAPAASAPPLAAPPAAPDGLGRRLGVLIGAAVLLVVGLYFVTVASRNAAPAGGAGADTTAETAPGAAPAGAPPTLAPLSAEVEAQVTALQEQVDAASGAAKQTKQRELVNLLIGVGRPDRAAEVQEALATTTAAPADWKRAGDLLYGWMELLPEAGRPAVAARVIAAYERVLAADANDLDARTNLGWAAQYAGDNPMRAIEETLAVLGKDSTHVGANYNRAWLLMRIGRTEQAIAQLQKVIRLAGPATPLGREAASMVEQLRAGPPAGGISAGPAAGPSIAPAPGSPSAPGAPAPAP